jgi:hypothetical protein
MKISELINQLNTLKELHGDVEAVAYNPEYANYDTVVRIHPVYPGYPSYPGLKEDKNAPAWGVNMSTF